jgi:hypothetical protein
VFVQLAGADDIIPSAQVKLYLEAATVARRRYHAENKSPQNERGIEILYCEHLNHAEILGYSWGLHKTKLGIQKVYSSLWGGQ